MELNQIKTYLSVCDDAPAFIVGDKSFLSGSRQVFNECKLELLENDILSITIPDHVTMTVGDASGITGIAIRYCGDKGSIIAQYAEPMMNLTGCCICCKIWCIYGSSGCSCTIPK